MSDDHDPDRAPGPPGGDGPLPPDPWADAAGPPPPPGASTPPSSGTSSPLQHPAFWIGLTVLCVVALLAAYLDVG